MNWNKWIRQTHRWTAILFTLTIAGVFAILVMGMPPAMWVYYMPLLPLYVLLPTGLYMFVQPHAGRWRNRRRAGGEA